MSPQEIPVFCEMIAIYNKEIGKAIAAKKRLQYEQRSRFLGAGIDASTGGPLAAVAIKFEDGETWELLDPERWLDVYKKTRAAYRKYIDESIPEALDLYYEKGKNQTQAYTRAGVSRTKFFEQRKKFIWMLALYALQDGVLSVDE